MFNYLYLRDRRKDTKVGFSAALGTACHGLFQSVLCLGEDINKAVAKAQADIEFHTAPSGEPEDKRQKFKEVVPEMAESGLSVLSDLFGGSEDEKRVELHLDGVDVPIIGYIDLVSDNLFCEVKTKAPKRGAEKKDGTRSYSKASIPKAPDYKHMCQVSIYAKATGLIPTVAYVAAHGSVLYTPDNCEELQPERIDFYIEEVRGKAIRWQNLLKYSTDPHVLAQIIEPDFSSFYWDPDLLQEARELWKI